MAHPAQILRGGIPGVLVLSLVGCITYTETDGPKKDAAGDSDTDTDADTDTDTAIDTGDTDTGDTDTGDTGTETTFSGFVAEADFVEATDVVATADTVYAVGFASTGEAAVVSIDVATGTLTTLYTGAPLLQPSGIALNEDSAELLISDVASDEGIEGMNGGVYSLPLGSASMTEIGVAGNIDMPGDVAVGHGGTFLYVTGFTSGGEAALFTVSDAGAVSPVVTSGNLVDPMAIAVHPDGSMVYVEDSLAGGGQSPSIIAYEVPGYIPTVVSAGFNVAFPGGLASSDGGGLLYYTTIGSPGLVEIADDGSAMTVLDTAGMLELPAGVAAIAGSVYVAELSSAGSSDLYVLSY